MRAQQSVSQHSTSLSVCIRGRCTSASYTALGNLHPTCEMELGLQTAASLSALRNGLAASTASCVLQAWKNRQLSLFVLAGWGWVQRDVESGLMGSECDNGVCLPRTAGSWGRLGMLHPEL